MMRPCNHCGGVRTTGYLLVVITAISFSTNGPVTRLAVDAGLEPRDLAALRIFGSALLLGVTALGLVWKLRGRDLLMTAAFGIVVSMALFLYSEAVQRLDVAVALVIVYLNPAVVAIWQRVAHGDRLPRTAQWAMVLAMAGVAAMVFGAGGGIGQVSLLGLLLALGTMLCASGQVIIAPALPRHLTPVQRTGAGMMFGALLWIVAAPVWGISWSSLADPATLGNLGGELPIGALVLWLTVVGTAIPFLTLVAGTVRIGPGAASVVTMIEPVAAAGIAWAVLDQSLTAVQILGAGVALLGILLVELARTRQVVAVPATHG